jgi:RNA polymerase sigma-70 factor (ECF subfamily)
MRMEHLEGAGIALGGIAQVSAESDLIARSVGGDLEAYDQLVGVYQDRVYQVAYRVTGNHEDAWDVAQEAFVHAFRSMARFRGAATFSTWLHRITVNAALDLVRRRPPQPSVPLDAVVMSGGHEPADAAARADMQRRIHHAIAALPVDQRVVVVLRDLQELTYEEIAAVLRIPVGTVRSRLSRGRETLRRHLADLAPAGGS